MSGKNVKSQMFVDPSNYNNDGKPPAELSAEQVNVLSSIRKELATKLKSGNCGINDIETATDRIEKNGIPDDFLLYNTGTYPVLDAVYDLLFKMLFYVGTVDDTLLGVHERLVRIKANLEHLRVTGAYITEDVTLLQNELAEIDSLDDGLNIRLPGAGSGVPMGQALLHTLLHKCHRVAHNLLVRTEVDPAVEPVMLLLSGLVREAENLKGRADVTLEEITTLQKQLVEIDSARVDGKFFGTAPPTGPVPEGQAVLVTMLERAFDGVHDLLQPSQADQFLVDANLMGLYTELSQIVDRLSGLKARRFKHPVQLELRKAQQRLLDIDEERRDGKFLDIDGRIGAGQAVLHYMMARGFDLCYEILCSEEGNDLEHMDAAGPLYLLLVEARTALKEVSRSTRDVAVIEGVQRSIQDVQAEMHRLGLFEPTNQDGAALRSLYRETLELLQFTLARSNM